MVLHKELVAVIILVLLVSGCVGLQRDRDGGGPGPIPEPIPQAAITCRGILPSATDASIGLWNTAHYVCSPDKAFSELFVFIPGTNAAPENYTELIEEAAKMGIASIGISYANTESINLDVCRGSDAECFRGARNEVIYGVDSSSKLNIERADSISGRLEALLAYLEITYPEQNWDMFRDGSGVKWSSVIISGHSQGGGHAAFISKEEQVKRAVIFSWVDVVQGQLAPWVLEPGATPAQNYYIFYHQDDGPIASNQPKLIDALKLGPLGEIVNVDTTPPPYKNSHTLTTDIPVPPTQDRTSVFNAHNIVAVDAALIETSGGLDTYRTVWQYMITGTFSEPVDDTPDGQSGVITKTSVKLNPSGETYTDPEFLSSEDLALFVGEGRTLWLADMNPGTGKFLSNNGKNVMVASDLTPLAQTNNGGEFGIDKDGWDIFYTKSNNGIPNTWRAHYSGGSIASEPLTSNIYPTSGNQVTTDRSAASIRVAINEDSATGLILKWFDEESPMAQTDVDAGDVISPRWAQDTRIFLYPILDGASQGQIMYYDTVSGVKKVITSDSGAKKLVWGWHAPEFNNELLVLAVVDERAIVVYRDTGKDHWEKIMTITIPEVSDKVRIGSPETFIAGGKSYISSVAKTATNDQSELWVYSLDGDSSSRLSITCDDGLGEVIRSDPESYIGDDQAFVYYNVISRVGMGLLYDLYMCPTGIAV